MILEEMKNRGERVKSKPAQYFENLNPNFSSLDSKKVHNDTWYKNNRSLYIVLGEKARLKVIIHVLIHHLIMCGK